jgi:hypothetical protein
VSLMEIYPELRDAAEAVLKDVDQPEEYKRRLLRLLENATRDNVTDGDVRAVIQLAEVDEMED